MTMLATRERSVPVWEAADRRLHVAVVHADQAARHGLARLLEHDSRLHLMDPVARVAELRTAGLRFDACVLGLPETTASDEMTELIYEVPCVVWTSVRHWRPWVAAWVWGARDVVGGDVGQVPFADAVWDAVHNPGQIHPQLARALLAGLTASGLHAPSTLRDVLGCVAEGRPLLSALSTAGVPLAGYADEIAALRAAFDHAGLGMLPADEASHHDAGERRSFEPSSVPPEALALSSRVREVLRYYADGYDYEEIAQLLSITEATVKTHVLTAMDKFGITANRTSEVRLLFALYISGRHRKPDLVRRRLCNIRDAS